MENLIFRKDKIVELCRGKTVLHLGFIEHSYYEKKIEIDDWLHKKIAQVANRLVGLDYLEKEVNNIRKKYGYECYQADVMKLNEVQLNEKFDVIVCGELIGHIENPGLMLDGIKQFMHKDSILIITTPNPWSTERINLLKLGKTDEQWINQELVGWYSLGTLKHLLERKKYEIILSDYYYSQNSSDIYKNIQGIIGKLKLIKRIIKKKHTKKHLQDGLFFVCKIKS